MTYPGSFLSGSQPLRGHFLPGCGVPGSSMTDREKAQVLDELVLDRALTRIAHEIVEQAGGGENVVLVGIKTRGVTLAHRIAEKVATIEGPSPRWAPSTSRSTGTTSASRPSSRSCAAPRSPSLSRDASWCWWTTCSSPAAPSAPPWTPSWTWAGPASSARRPGGPGPLRAAHSPGLHRQEPPDQPSGIRGRHAPRARRRVELGTYE